MSLFSQTTNHLRPLPQDHSGNLRNDDRLQAMKLRLQKYDITVKYHMGKEMHIADTLSSAYLPEALSGKENDIIYVNVIQHISVSPDRIKEIQHHTATDDTSSS